MRDSGFGSTSNARCPTGRIAVGTPTNSASTLHSLVLAFQLYAYGGTASFSSSSIGLKMAIVVLVSQVCTFLLPEMEETTLKDTDTHNGRWGGVGRLRKVPGYDARVQEVW